MVQLIDLWVATLLPGNFLDLDFELVTSGTGDGIHRVGPIDALRFAHGLVALGSQELWWDKAGGDHLNGLRLHGVVASARPEPARPSAIEEPRRSVSDVDLRRLLPHVSRPYPFVVWRVLPMPVVPRRHSDDF
jgi:hypothetical protein